MIIKHATVARFWPTGSWRPPGQSSHRDFSILPDVFNALSRKGLVDRWTSIWVALSPKLGDRCRPRRNTRICSQFSFFCCFNRVSQKTNSIDFTVHIAIAFVHIWNRTTQSVLDFQFHHTVWFPLVRCLLIILVNWNSVESTSLPAFSNTIAVQLFFSLPAHELSHF